MFLGLSNNSSTEDIFNSNKSEYEKALRESGHKAQLTYRPQNRIAEEMTTTKNRNRNITWYNPPFGMHVKTKIGKKFLELIDHHFPSNHELHRICNRNTIKVSYSCTTNMANLIKAHNNKLTNKIENRDETCNCRRKQDCPLPGKCTINNVIYEAIVKTTNETKHYIGLTSNMFKTRYTAHKASFSNPNKKNSTELSKHIWQLKAKGTPYDISWKIIKRADPYSPKSHRCNLCLWEKYFITTADKSKLLNSRSELISTCRHRRKFLLSEYG